MKTGIFLSYKGIGANLLHLSYCHQIAERFGPVTIITLCSKLDKILETDPKIKEVIYLDKYHKNISDILNLSAFFKNLKLDNIFIFYPSVRYFLACKISGIKNIYQYPLFKKKNLHLVKTAKKFTEKILKIENCPTETKFNVDEKKLKNYKIENKKIIILGIGSSGPTTKWGYKNYLSLIKKFENLESKFHYFLLCGPDESDAADEIIKELNIPNCKSLANENISEVIYYISSSNLFIGNDSFGHHVASQRKIPSFIIMLDTPEAYTSYSKFQNRIIPQNISIDKITHDTRLDPNLISVDDVFNSIKQFI